MADQHKFCKKSQAGRGNSWEPSWGGVDLSLCMPPPLPRGPSPQAHLLPSCSNSLSISSSGMGWEANQGLQLEATCMIEPSLTPRKEAAGGIQPSRSGHFRREKSFCEASKPLKGPRYPAVTTQIPPIFLGSWYHQATSWLLGVVPAAGWGNSNQKSIRGGLGWSSEHPQRLIY